MPGEFETQTERRHRHHRQKSWWLHRILELETGSRRKGYTERVIPIKAEELQNSSGYVLESRTRSEARGSWKTQFKFQNENEDGRSVPLIRPKLLLTQRGVRDCSCVPV